MLVAGHGGGLVDGADRAVRTDEAVVEVKLPVMFDGGIERCLDSSPVVGVHALQEIGETVAELVGLEVEDAIDLVRPTDVTGDHVPVPTADVSDGLGGGEHFLAAEELPGGGGTAADFFFQLGGALRDELLDTLVTGELQAREAGDDDGEYSACQENGRRLAGVKRDRAGRRLADEGPVLAE